MYRQFTFDSSLGFTAEQGNYQKCIIAGNYVMLFSLLLVLTCLTISFGFESSFNMALIIASHILTIVFAGLFKIGYVVRCIGVYGLGYKVF